MRKLLFVIFIATNVFASRLQFTKVGPLFRSYYAYYPSIVDMRGNATFPYDWALYASTDHLTGGIALYVANGDPSDTNNWLTYTEAVAAGGFDSYGTKPVDNPIFNDTEEGTQTETPCVQLINDVLYMTYHIGFTDNADGQATLLATSTDGVNFTRYTAHTGGVTAVILPQSAFPEHSNHTGYFRWGNNPFTGVNYTYVGYSLLVGATLTPLVAQWGSNDAINWDFLNSIETSKPYGGLTNLPESYSIAVSSLDLSSATILPNGEVSVFGHAKPNTTGGTLAYGNIYEMNIKPDGLTFARNVEAIIEHGAEGEYDEYEAVTPTTCRYGNKTIVIYQGADDESYNTLSIAVCEDVDTNVINILPIRDPNIEHTIEYTQNFEQTPALSALPEWLSWVPQGTATYTLTDSGLRMAPKLNYPGFRMSTGVNPTEYEMIEIYTRGVFDTWATTGIAIKTGTTYQTAAQLVDAVAGLAYSSIAMRYQMWTRIATTTYDTATTSFHTWGGLQGFGIRWWPQKGKAQLIGTGRATGHMWDLTAGMNLDQTFYPCFWWQGATSGANALIKDITIRLKPVDTTLPAVTTPAIVNKNMAIPITKTIDYGIGGAGGFSLNTTIADSVHITYRSGIGTDTLHYELDRYISPVETLTLSYIQPDSGWQDINNNFMATFSDTGVASTITDPLTLDSVGISKFITWGTFPTIDSAYVNLEKATIDGANGDSLLITAASPLMWSRASYPITLYSGVVPYTFPYYYLTGSSSAKYFFFFGGQDD